MKTPSILGVNLGLDGVFMKKWEISILIAIVVTIVYCAATPSLTSRWWTTAFAPLCDGILTADAGGTEIVLRSKLWELVQGVF